MNYVIIIPSLEPDEILLPYIHKLISAGIKRIIVVNDGSSRKCDCIFDEISNIKECDVLTHEINRGKGAAIKTALKFYIAHCDGFDGVITVDADGQHSVRDVMRMCEAMAEHPDSFVLGCREFGEETPSKSLYGNRITSVAMRLFYGISLTDTQTGLRGIPNFMTEELLNVRGTRYEYELNMLIHAKGHSVPFVIIPIETIYFDNNSGSHYRPIIDSARIFVKVIKGLIWFSASAICSAAIDLAIYGFLTKVVLSNFSLFWMLLIAFVTARAISSAVNFALNRRLPSSQNKNIADTMPKYYTLVISQMFVSFLCIYLLCASTNIDEMIIRIMVDCVLGLISYQMQLRWVFRDKNSTFHKREEMN